MTTSHCGNGSFLPGPGVPTCAPRTPAPVDQYVGSNYYDPNQWLPVSSLFPPLDSPFNLLTSVLISLCRLFADFTRHNFYQLALKRGITNWGLLPILERTQSRPLSVPTEPALAA